MVRSNQRSQVIAEPDNLTQQEVNVLLLCSRIGEHTPEEIDSGSQRLVANQNRALLHHPAFDSRSYLQRDKVKITIGMNPFLNCHSPFKLFSPISKYLL